MKAFDYSLRTFIAKELGERLIHMAGVTASRPEAYLFQDTWTALLMEHGTALQEYYLADSDDQMITIVMEERAQAAMHFVAEHFFDLWS